MSDEAAELKSLQCRKRALEQEAYAARGNMREAQARNDKIQAELREIKQQIRALEAAGSPIVSEHALLRYVERVMGIDLDEIRGLILTERNVKAIKFAGNCTIKSGPLEFVVKNNVVTTVMD